MLDLVQLTENGGALSKTNLVLNDSWLNDHVKHSMYAWGREHAGKDGRSEFNVLLVACRNYGTLVLQRLRAGTGMPTEFSASQQRGGFIAGDREALNDIIFAILSAYVERILKDAVAIAAVWAPDALISLQMKS